MNNSLSLTQDNISASMLDSPHTNALHTLKEYIQSEEIEKTDEAFDQLLQECSTIPFINSYNNRGGKNWLRQALKQFSYQQVKKDTLLQSPNQQKFSFFLILSGSVGIFTKKESQSYASCELRDANSFPYSSEGDRVPEKLKYLLAGYELTQTLRAGDSFGEKTILCGVGETNFYVSEEQSEIVSMPGDIFNITIKIRETTKFESRMKEVVNDKLLSQIEDKKHMNMLLQYLPFYSYKYNEKLPSTILQRRKLLYILDGEFCLYKDHGEELVRRNIEQEKFQETAYRFQLTIARKGDFIFQEYLKDGSFSYDVKCITSSSKVIEISNRLVHQVLFHYEGIKERLEESAAQRKKLFMSEIPRCLQRITNFINVLAETADKNSSKYYIYSRILVDGGGNNKNSARKSLPSHHGEKLLTEQPYQKESLLDTSHYSNKTNHNTNNNPSSNNNTSAFKKINQTLSTQPDTEITHFRAEESNNNVKHRQSASKLTLPTINVAKGGAAVSYSSAKKPRISLQTELLGSGYQSPVILMSPSQASQSSEVSTSRNQNRTTNDPLSNLQSIKIGNNNNNSILLPQLKNNIPKTNSLNSNHNNSKSHLTGQFLSPQAQSDFKHKRMSFNRNAVVVHDKFLLDEVQMRQALREKQLEEELFHSKQQEELQLTGTQAIRDEVEDKKVIMIEMEPEQQQQQQQLYAHEKRQGTVIMEVDEPMESPEKKFSSLMGKNNNMFYQEIDRKKVEDAIVAQQIEDQKQQQQDEEEIHKTLKRKQPFTLNKVSMVNYSSTRTLPHQTESDSEVFQMSSSTRKMKRVSIKNNGQQQQKADNSNIPSNKLRITISNSSNYNNENNFNNHLFSTHSRADSDLENVKMDISITMSGCSQENVPISRRNTEEQTLMASSDFEKSYNNTNNNNNPARRLKTKKDRKSNSTMDGYDPAKLDLSQCSRITEEQPYMNSSKSPLLPLLTEMNQMNKEAQQIKNRQFIISSNKKKPLYETTKAQRKKKELQQQQSEKASNLYKKYLQTEGVHSMKKTFTNMKFDQRIHEKSIEIYKNILMKQPQPYSGNEVERKSLTDRSLNFFEKNLKVLKEFTQQSKAQAVMPKRVPQNLQATSNVFLPTSTRNLADYFELVKNQSESSQTPKNGGGVFYNFKARNNSEALILSKNTDKRLQQQQQQVIY